ncbi:MAG: tRNA 2-thiocytidine biosynthesis protein TtcA [Defluviitaleaceae bacterium]|nr:tRNA 2-thiocytidine biosynthesis protein TtcA [Defluviitaleaceae bacterium]
MAEPFLTGEIMQTLQNIERSIIKKFRKLIWSKFIKAIKDYEMVKENDKVCVCISGGKDSMLLAKCLQELKKHGKVDFELKFLVTDPGYDKDNLQKVLDNAHLLGIDINVVETHIFEIVQNVEDSPCYLCARMRRGHLYSSAKELGCNKIALGHHQDDVIETIMLNLCYGSEIKTMMPKLHSSNFEGMELIRPLYYIGEKDIIAWKNTNSLTFINCACPLNDACDLDEGSLPKIGKRREMKNLLKTIDEINPEIKQSIFRSLENVNIEAVIGYRKAGKRHNFMDDYEKI